MFMTIFIFLNYSLTTLEFPDFQVLQVIVHSECFCCTRQNPILVAYCCVQSGGAPRRRRVPKRRQQRRRSELSAGTENCFNCVCKCCDCASHVSAGYI